MKKKSICFSLPLVFLLFAGCSLGNYDKAHSQYLRGRYAASIENYDQYLRLEKNGANRTVAEGERADAYFHLGKRAYELGRLDLAIRFYFLSNSIKADNELDLCYYDLAKKAMDEGDTAKALEYYDIVVKYLPTSEFYPEILYQRIRLNLEQRSDVDVAWSDYKVMCDRFPGNEWIEKAQPYIDPYMARFIDQAVARKRTDGYEAALEDLFALNQYPSSYRARIYLEISEIYLQRAESFVDRREYLEAEKNFRAAVDYDPKKETLVQDRLRQICRFFIDKGDELVMNRQIDDAIRYYERTFTIIPNYDVANTSIERARRVQKSIDDAKASFDRGVAAERAKEYSRALEAYREANRLDPLREYEQKVFYMTNMVLIESDASGFARKIVSEYNGGKIIREISKIENQLRSVFGDDVHTSGWRYMVSVGNYKYEVRYDITSPDQSYYFVWLVNLLERTITPLNKVSDEISK